MEWLYFWGMNRLNEIWIVSVIGDGGGCGGARARLGREACILGTPYPKKDSPVT